MQKQLQQKEQGFFSSRIVIHETSPIHLHTSNQRPTDYRPRVFNNNQIPILKKLPSQVQQSFSQINDLSQFSSRGERAENVSDSRWLSGESMHPFSKYLMDVQTYKLVYSKNNKSAFISSFEQNNFASRQVQLMAPSYDQRNFNLLKSITTEQVLSPQDQNNQYLKIDSKFQCGNLLCSFVQLKQQNIYHCFIQNDTNTEGYNQFFYFSVMGMRKDTVYTFYILNFRKKFSFFKNGMKPVLFSLKRHINTGNGWGRGCFDITYKTSPVYFISNDKKIKLYCLKFSLKHQYDDDFVTLSSGLPYSYSRMISQLDKLQILAKQNNISWQKQTIAYSLSYNQVPYITISNCIDSYGKENIKKNIIIVLARQHPGETNSSYLAQELLNNLVKGQSQASSWLLRRVQFRVFPMINVDGVIYGNFRCDLAGFDLNRAWKYPIKELHPQIHAIKQQIVRLSNQNNILCCLDLHSHSKQYNIFSYCCKEGQVQSRILSFMISKLTPLFHFPSCTFGLSKFKETTARAIVSSISKQFNVLTIQTSSYAAKNKGEVVPLGPKHFKQMIEGIVSSLKSYFSDDQFKNKCEDQIKERVGEFLQYSRRNWEEMSGSDSDPEADAENIQLKLRKILPPSSLKNVFKKIHQIQRTQIKQQKQQQNSISLLKQSQSHQSQIKIQNKIDKQVKRKDRSVSLRRQKKITGRAITKQQKQPAAKSKELSNKQRIDQKIIIELPKDEAKFKNIKQIKHINIRQPKITNFPKAIDQIKQKWEQPIPYNSSDKLVGSSFKHSMKILYSQIKLKHDRQTQLRTVSLDEAKLLYEKDGSKRQKKESKPKQVVRRQRIIKKIRSKSIIALVRKEDEQMRVNEGPMQIRGDFHLRIHQKNDSLYKRELLNQIERGNQQKIISKQFPDLASRKRQSIHRLNDSIKINASIALISKMWQANFQRYSKDLN